MNEQDIHIAQLKYEHHRLSRRIADLERGERRKVAITIMSGIASAVPFNVDPNPKFLAKTAVEYADALIAELDKPTPVPEPTKGTAIRKL